MVEIVWEFVVKQEFRGQFELAYGPGGAWGKLFAKYPGFRGTTLLRDKKDPWRYLTIDLWKKEAQWDQALEESKDEYADLDAAFNEWTESEKELGTFSILADATVRPKARRSSRRKTG